MTKGTNKAPELPDWAVSIWESYGKPEVCEDILTGPLIDRRRGIRRDDIVEILLDPRALIENAELFIRGRLIGINKMSLEILDQEGSYRWVSRDIVVEVKLIAHLRPPYIDDTELLHYEREDQKRRAKLHEDVEKESKGGGDEHIWG
ncbi:MAG: hypothetical protein QF440_02860 [Candidatus Thalassarchaeaceae archaeon]|jgi:hypothetical protein|nr:hypothetical protein [Candidatus Thalassarchaeaceae archaeon]